MLYFNFWYANVNSITQQTFYGRKNVFLKAKRNLIFPDFQQGAE